MKQQIIATIRANLIFYRRNLLLLGLGIALLFFYSLSMISTLLFTSTSIRFDTVKQTFLGLNGMASTFTALLGLLTLYYHINNRSMKMILTKPCRPETWLLGTFLSTLLFSSFLYEIIFVIAFIIFSFYGYSFAQGLLYISVYYFISGLNIFAILTLLTVIMHPVIAAIVSLFFQETTFYGLLALVMSGLKLTPDNKMLLFLKYTIYSIYLVLPQYDPFHDEIREVFETFRVTGADVVYLGYTLLYTIVLSSFCFFLTSYLLKKKRLI